MPVTLIYRIKKKLIEIISILEKFSNKIQMLKREKFNKYLILIISFKYKIHQLHSFLQTSSFKNSNLLVSGNKVAPNYKKSNNKTSKSIELNIRTNKLVLEGRNYLVLLTHLVQISILFNLTYH